MSTQALDLATPFHALRTIAREFLGPGRVWHAQNNPQERFFGLYSEHGPKVDRIEDLVAKASTDYRVLNAFLKEHDWDPMFDPFDGIGVASILDKFVKWLVEGLVTQIRAQNDVVYPAFELVPDSVNVYRVEGYTGPLAELRTRSKDVLYIMPAQKPLAGLDLVETIFDVVSRNRSYDSRYEGLIAPKVDFDVRPDLGWLFGASTFDQEGQFWFIAQAFQRFKFRMNEKGARARVVTGMVLMKGIDLNRPVPLVIDRPFLAWFTQEGVNFPMATCYVDYDSWREPAGSLEDL